MRFTMVNFVYLFYTIVKGFYLSKLLSVTSTNNWLTMQGIGSSKSSSDFW